MGARGRRRGRPKRRERGSLVVVGTGLRAAAQLTPEARGAIVGADRVLYLLSDPLSERWIKTLKPAAQSLASCYVRGGPRAAAYERMIERILAPVRSGHRVCAAFYGHAGVAVIPSHEAIRRARREGFDAEMLPGISSEDCLFSELGLDPLRSGCQSYEATDFLIYQRRFDPSSALVLWQAGVVGRLEYGTRATRAGLRRLAQRLARAYGIRHEVMLYEASLLPVIPSTIRRTTIGDLPTAGVTAGVTIYVPPRPRAADARALRYFGLRPSGDDADDDTYDETRAAHQAVRRSN